MLLPGEVWVAPGGLHLELERSGTTVRLRTQDGPPENSCRPSVDVLFRSVALLYGSRTLAVVLTGMGQDGLRGCERIREAGGQVLAQDEASSVVWGMPGAVSQAGLANRVLPLSQLAFEINRRVQPRADLAPAFAAAAAGSPRESRLPSTMSPADFEFVCNFVRTETAVVLEPGKEYLVESRLQTLARREKLGSIDLLVSQLRAGPINGIHHKVVSAMTTHETSFFRDLHPFEALRKTILPELMARRAGEQKLNLWCGAASTGQEPYSILMMLKEHFPTLLTWDLRFTATDVCAEVVARAKAGSFSQLEVNRGLPVPNWSRTSSKEGTPGKSGRTCAGGSISGR